MNCSKKIFIVFFTVVATTSATDYCSKDICAQQNHIACGNDGNFGPSCPADRSVVPMTADLIALILQRHNTARMNIANGAVSGFLTANRMIEMSWDDELASFALMNAMTCIFAHDQCRNTAVFKYAGQNLAMLSQSPTYRNTTASINQFFDSWFNEYVDCPIEQTQKLSTITAANGKTFGHFTQVIMANSYKIGCAIVNYSSNTWKNTLLACDYSQTNVISWPVYTTGSPCSQCLSGCSSSFPGLCSANEIP